MWDSDEPVPRSDLLKGVQGAEGIICMLSDKIDAEVLNAAGTSGYFTNSFNINLKILFVKCQCQCGLCLIQGQT